MQCPVCKNIQLEEKSYKDGTLILDRCAGCNGAWFDKSELHTLLARRSAGYFEIPRISPQSDRIRCPKCNEGMYELCYPGTTVFIDMCKSCRGIWLDQKEWDEISKARAVKPKEAVAKKVVTETEPSKLTSSNGESTSYTDDIPGIKGSLLRFIEHSIEHLTDYSSE